MSELLQITGDTLCVKLRIWVPEQFAVIAKLFSSRNTPRTVYKAESTTGDKKAVDMSSVFEVPLSANDGDRVQLVVYVSLNVVIKTANISIGHCSINSMYL